MIDSCKLLVLPILKRHVNSYRTVATLSFRDADDNLLMTSDVLESGGARVTTDSSGNPAVLLSVADQDEFIK